jgi:hypothetical protein
MALTFPASPSTGTTFVNDNGTEYTYTAKGAWRCTKLGRKLLSQSGVLTLSPTTLNAMVVGVAFTQTITASGGTPAYTYAKTGGTLPTGLTLNTSTGVLSGTPTTAGVFNFEVTATDSGGLTGRQPYTATVTASAITLAPTVLPAMTRWNPFSQTVTASGGTAPYAYSSTGLPTGLSINSATGAITGIPTISGPYTAVVTAVDSAGTPKSGSRTYAGVVAESAITIFPTSIGPLTKSVPVSIAMSETGGVAPFIWGLFSGALPTGLSLNASTGILSGTPTTIATSTPVIKATDTNSLVGARAYTIDVVAAATGHFYAGYAAPSPSQYANGDFYFDSLTHTLYHKAAGGWSDEIQDFDNYFSVLWAQNAEGDVGGDVIFNSTLDNSLGKPGDVLVIADRVYTRKLGYGNWDSEPLYYYDMYTTGVPGSLPLRGTIADQDGGVHPYIFDKFTRRLYEWNGVSYGQVSNNTGKLIKSFTGDGSIYASATAAGQTWGVTGSIAIDLARPAIYLFTSASAWSLVRDFR